jgi:hypothetical protein
MNAQNLPAEKEWSFERLARVFSEGQNLEVLDICREGSAKSGIHNTIKYKYLLLCE